MNFKYCFSCSGHRLYKYKLDICLILSNIPCKGMLQKRNKMARNVLNVKCSIKYKKSFINLCFCFQNNDLINYYCGKQISTMVLKLILFADPSHFCWMFNFEVARVIEEYFESSFRSNSDSSLLYINGLLGIRE